MRLVTKAHNYLGVECYLEWMLPRQHMFYLALLPSILVIWSGPMMLPRKPMLPRLVSCSDLHATSQQCYLDSPCYLVGFGFVAGMLLSMFLDTLLPRQV